MKQKRHLDEYTHQLINDANKKFDDLFMKMKEGFNETIEQQKREYGAQVCFLFSYS